MYNIVIFAIDLDGTLVDGNVAFQSNELKHLCPEADL